MPVSAKPHYGIWFVEAAAADLAVRVGVYVAVALGVGGVGALLGTLMFGRNYKKRIADLEAQAKGPSISHTVNYHAAGPDPEREIRAAAAQAETVQNLEQTIRNLPQHPMGDGATYADLPEHTRIVSLPDGRYLLALPISVSFRAGAPRVSVTIPDPGDEDTPRG